MGKELENIIRKSQGNYIVDKKITQGDLILTDKVLKFNKKSIWVFILFGLIGNSLAKGKTILEINLMEIDKIEKGKFKLNKNIIEVSTKDGSLYKFSANSPKKWFEILEPIVAAINK